MTERFQIKADWEPLDEGSVEERSCFAALSIRANGLWVTEGQDAIANRLRQAPFLSAYHLAEWLAWNWWRLRWEPRSASEDWDLAHRVTSIGGGYIWPNLTIFSDGQRTALISKAGREQESAPFRYVANVAAVIPSSEFETQIDEFVGQVLERLDTCGVRDSNLNTLWEELALERADRDITRVRKVEALLGLQPDQLDDATRETLFECEDKYGEGAIDELAADRGNARRLVVTSPDELAKEATRHGYSTQVGDMVVIRGEVAQPRALSTTPAWRVGADIAKALRSQEGLADDALISDRRLSEMLSVDRRALEGDETTRSGVSFLLADPNGDGKVMLRSPRKTGRRFELARLLGDCTLSQGGALHPATRAYTYRQKAQRSFAAELLSPFTGVFNLLQGDYSPESQAEVAEHFQVSEMTISTQLMNHGILARDYLDADSEPWQVAA